VTATIELVRDGERVQTRGDDTACHLCGAATWSYVELGDVPALCNEFHSTAGAAQAAARGQVELSLCAACGLIANTAFDETRFSYTPEYDNALERSATFRRYTDELAARLVERYVPTHGEVVEIGCGSGHFLTTLAELGDNCARGFDPSYDARRGRIPRRGTVEITNEPYRAELGAAADLVVCRHVLEHFDDPAALVRSVGDALGDGVAYFEVPDATFMLDEFAFWDVIHEHRSYFGGPTLRWLFETAGLEVLDTGRSFGGQFLWIEARRAPSPITPQRPDTTNLPAAMSRFARSFHQRVAQWRLELAAVDPGRVAVWGMGAKGVMFLNLVDPTGRIAGAVDINPTKHGRFVPGTGQRVIGPDKLAVLDPEMVVVMNPVYRAEIEQLLTRDGLTPRVRIP